MSANKANVCCSKSEDAEAFAAAKRELDGQLVLTRWKKKKQKGRREGEWRDGEWWPGTIKVDAGQMYVITRPNGRKRPHVLNTTYHSIPWHFADVKLLVPSESARLLLTAMISAKAFHKNSSHEAAFMLGLQGGLRQGAWRTASLEAPYLSCQR